MHLYAIQILISNLFNYNSMFQLLNLNVTCCLFLAPTYCDIDRDSSLQRMGTSDCQIIIL